MEVRTEIKDKIIAAANALAAEGHTNPTNDAVRERMGGGSFATISPVMREWRAARQSEAVATLEMPADLRRAIESSVGNVWNIASKLASASVETVRVEAVEAAVILTEERDEALVEVARLEKQLSDLQNVLSEKGLALSQSRERIEMDQAQISRLVSDNAVLTTRIENWESQIAGMQGDLKEARGENKQLQTQLIEIARRRGSA